LFPFAGGPRREVNSMTRSPRAALLLLFLVLPARAQDEQQTGYDDGLLIDLTLPELLENHYQAIGGLEDWDEVETKKATGRMTVAPGAEAAFTWYRKRPNKMRLEFVVQGVTGVEVYDGTNGWTLLPFAGQTEPTPMPEEMLEQLEVSADFDGPLAHWQEKGYALELVGYEQIGSLKTYKVKMTVEEGRELTFFIDGADWLLDRIEGKTLWEGAEAEYEVTLGEYEEVGPGGLLEAFSIRQGIKGQPGGPEIVVETVELDVEMPDSLFAMPAAAPAPAEPSEP
jgi:hypothetical protein